MARIQLILYVEPGSAEAFVNIRFKDGSYERLIARIDTGAMVSLFPLVLLEKAEHRLSARGKFVVEQAGIAEQTFEAVEAFVDIFLEDAFGSRTREIEIRAWFADTEINLAGFDGLLDQVTLYIDMRQTRTGWIEMDA